MELLVLQSQLRLEVGVLEEVVLGLLLVDFFRGVDDHPNALLLVEIDGVLEFFLLLLAESDIGFEAVVVALADEERLLAAALATEMRNRSKGGPELGVGGGGLDDD